MSIGQSRERNIELGRRFNDLWNARDPTFWELPTPTAVIHIGKATPSVAQSKAAEAPLLEAMPDCRREILRETADDDHFIHHWRCFGHLASNGRLVEWEGCTWARLENGRITEIWIFGDPRDPRLE